MDGAATRPERGSVTMLSWHYAAGPRDEQHRHAGRRGRFRGVVVVLGGGRICTTYALAVNTPAHARCARAFRYV
eukprot:scaffold7153_cov60-Phaeocystis_antarctica.AAC.2